MAIQVCNLTDMQLAVACKDIYGNATSVQLQPRARRQLPDGLTVATFNPRTLQVIDLTPEAPVAAKKTKATE